MRNPWLQLERNPPDSTFVLEMDRDYIQRHNAKYPGSPELKIMVNSIPEPFIGDPKSAMLVLLNLNPGHSDEDEEEHRDPKMKEALFRNLHHHEQEYSFYPLNPAFAKTGVGQWWRKRTRKLQEESGLDTRSFASKLLAIEWFPYHSKKCGLKREPVCSSQKYSHDLAKEMLHKQGVVVLGMKARNHWMRVDTAIERVPFLNSKQNAFITERNMPPGVFSDLVRALKDS